MSDERAAVGREGREKEKGKEAPLAAVAVRTSKANHYHLDARLFRWASLFQVRACRFLAQMALLRALTRGVASRQERLRSL
ncbi:hypothetical protein MRX96_039207 [Rhipicephalus microplus]